MLIVIPPKFQGTHDMLVGPCACKATHTLKDWTEHELKLFILS
jgi:hypothetical protein